MTTMRLSIALGAVTLLCACPSRPVDETVLLALKDAAVNPHLKKALEKMRERPPRSSSRVGSGGGVLGQLQSVQEAMRQHQIQMVEVQRHHRIGTDALGPLLEDRLSSAGKKRILEAFRAFCSKERRRRDRRGPMPSTCYAKKETVEGAIYGVCVPVSQFYVFLGEITDRDPKSIAAFVESGDDTLPAKGSAPPAEQPGQRSTSDPSAGGSASSGLGLGKAIEKGAIERVRTLLEEGTDANEMDEHGLRPLHHAASVGQTEVARLLITHGADVNGRARMKNLTPLHFAVIAGKRPVAALFIAKGADVDARDGSQQTPLGAAAMGGRADLTELLVSLGADINATDDQGKSALSLAKQFNHREVVKILTDVNAKDLHGSYAPTLHNTVRRNDLKAIDALLKKKDIDLNAQEKETGVTPLGIAAGLGQVEMATRLIAAGADVNAKERGGYTALHAAANTGKLEVARLLLDKGARTDLKDDKGETALSISDFAGRKDVAELLRSRGAK